MRVNNFAEQYITRDLVKQLNPESWLDIGIGDGLVAEEWRGLRNIRRKVGIDSYTKPDHPDKKIGEHCHNNWDIRKESYNENCSVRNEKFDVYTLMDVIEHFDKDKGLKILDHIESQNPKLIVVWTPEGFYPSDHHKSGWNKEDFEKRGYTVKIAQDFHLGPPKKANGLLAYKIREPSQIEPISIIIPKLCHPSIDNDKYYKKCIEFLKKHQTVEHEYLLMKNGKGTDLPQGQSIALNEGVKRAKNEIVMAINDDMLAPKNWEEIIPLVRKHKVISPNLTEPQAGAPPFIVNDLGRDIDNFDEEKFYNLNVEEDKIEGGFNLPFLTTKKLFNEIEGWDTAYSPWGSNADSDFQYRCMLRGIKPQRYRGVVFFHFSNVSGTFTLEESKPYWRRNTVMFERKWGIARAQNPEIWYCDFKIDSKNLRYRPSWAKLKDNQNVI